MDWSLVLWYGVGTPLIALLVSVWWLAHFANAWISSEQRQGPPKWSRLRWALVLMSGWPLFAPGVHQAIEWVLFRLCPSVLQSGHAIIVGCLVNGLL